MFKQLTLASGLFALLSAPAFAACEENASLDPTVVEVVEFRLASEATTSQFVMAAADLEAAFLCDAPGFVRWTLTQRPDGMWLDMVEWTTLDEALAAADAILVEPSAATFMQAIDPDSIKMNHWNINAINLARWIGQAASPNVGTEPCEVYCSRPLPASSD